MRFIGFFFLAFYALCAVVWLIGLALLIAELIPQKKQLKMHRWLKQFTRQLQKKFLPLMAMTILAGCCNTTAVQIKPSCPPMLRATTYRAMQADEIADYRIAVESCKEYRS